MGGAAGHMNHPFDIDWVRAGDDLIDFFLDAAEYLQEKPASIKWDGVNTSFKLITDENGRKDFRADRGDQTPMSVVGMTAEQAYTRWKPGHGMPVAIEKLLAIFNEALPKIEPELKALGMWDDPTKLFNTEYIGEGGSNVIQYGKNILAIHGINQFYEKKAQPHRLRQGTGMDRPGLPRPTFVDEKGREKPIQDKSVEIDYDRDALKVLIEKVQPIAAKYDFSILGDTPAENITPIDYESVLETSFPIKISEDNVENFSIREWLKDAVNPRDTRITTNEGKSIGALSKQVYIAVLNGVSLVDWLESQEDVEMAVNGAVFYHATKELGNAVKSALRVSEGVSGMLGWDPKFDNAANHEGVILRDPKFGPKPVKITGEFILEGLASTHGDSSKQAMAQETHPVDVQVEKTKLALLAGGFKPPHKGHLEMVKFYNQQVGPNGKVIILLGSGGKEPRTINGRTITAQDSMNIWDIFLRNEPTIPWPSSKIEFQNVEGAGPIAPIIDYVRDVAPEDQIILLGAGEKDEDRWPKIMANPRNNPRGLEIETTPAPNMVDDKGVPLSARNMRSAIERGDFETFVSYIPDSSTKDAEDIFAILGNANVEVPQEEPQEQLQEDNPLPLGIFLGLIEEELNKKLLYEQKETEISYQTCLDGSVRQYGTCPPGPHEEPTPAPEPDVEPAPESVSDVEPAGKAKPQTREPESTVSTPQRKEIEPVPEPTIPAKQPENKAIILSDPSNEEYKEVAELAKRVRKLGNKTYQKGGAKYKSWTRKGGYIDRKYPGLSQKDRENIFEVDYQKHILEANKIPIKLMTKEMQANAKAHGHVGYYKNKAMWISQETANTLKDAKRIRESGTDEEKAKLADAEDTIFHEVVHAHGDWRQFRPGGLTPEERKKGKKAWGQADYDFQHLENFAPGAYRRGGYDAEEREAFKKEFGRYPKATGFEYSEEHWRAFAQELDKKFTKTGETEFNEADFKRMYDNNENPQITMFIINTKKAFRRKNYDKYREKYYKDNHDSAIDKYYVENYLKAKEAAKGRKGYNEKEFDKKFHSGFNDKFKADFDKSFEKYYWTSLKNFANTWSDRRGKSAEERAMRPETAIAENAMLSLDSLVGLVKKELNLQQESVMPGFFLEGEEFRTFVGPQGDELLRHMDSKTWHDPETANTDNDDAQLENKEELEEVTAMATGQVAGAMTKGPFTGLDVDKENENEKERTKTLEENDELVEEVMNYLLYKIGV